MSEHANDNGLGDVTAPFCTERDAADALDRLAALLDIAPGAFYRIGLDGGYTLAANGDMVPPAAEQADRSAFAVWFRGWPVGYTSAAGAFVWVASAFPGAGADLDLFVLAVLAEVKQREAAG